MNDKILLGITGSAAAFKGVALASLLRKDGFSVDTVLTSAGQEFITPVQISCVTGGSVYTEMFNQDRSEFIPHIELTDGNAWILSIAADVSICLIVTAHTLSNLQSITYTM